MKPIQRIGGETIGTYSNYTSLDVNISKVINILHNSIVSMSHKGKYMRAIFKIIDNNKLDNLLIEHEI